MNHRFQYTSEIATCHPKATIYEAAKVMRDYHVGDVIVTEERSYGKQIPVGILTDRDIVVELIAQAIPLEKILVKDVMSTELVVADVSQNLKALISLMKLRGVRRLPVVDSNGELKGVICADDIMEEIAQEIASLAKLPKHQKHIEEELRGESRP